MTNSNNTPKKPRTSVRDTLLGLAILGGTVYVAARLGGIAGAQYTIKRIGEQTLNVNMTLPEGYVIVNKAAAEAAKVI